MNQVRFQVLSRRPENLESVLEVGLVMIELIKSPLTPLSQRGE
jgi:hypothetical protein